MGKIAQQEQPAGVFSGLCKGSLFCADYFPLSTSRRSEKIGRCAGFLSLILSTFVVTLAAAGESLLLVDDSEIPVVLSASRLKQSLIQAPASITVLDQELIEKSGARSLIELLYLVPGFQIGRPTYGDPVATYHGQATRYNPRLQLIVDGRPTYVPLYGGIPWSELPVSITDVERVEITRAPNGATYGPNSFNAVVSVTTRAPASGVRWRYSTEAGGNHFFTSTLTHNRSEGNPDLRFTVQAEGDEGFRDIEDRESSRLLSLDTDYQLNSTDTLGVSFGLQRGGHIEVDRISSDMFLSPYEETTNSYLQFVWERVKSVDSSLRVQYYYNYFDVSDEHLITLDAGEVLDQPLLVGTDLDIFLFRDTRSSRSEIEMQYSDRLSESHRVALGGALRKDTVMGNWLFADTRKRYIETARLFAHSEYQVNPQVSFNSGLLAEYNSLSGNTLSPRASLTYLYQRGSLFRLAYSRGVRSPLLFTEDGQIEIDAQLEGMDPITDIIIVNREEPNKPEFADVFDIAYARYLPGKKLSFDAKLSYQLVHNNFRTVRIQNYQEDLLDQQARYYTNDEESFSIKTLEFDLDFKPTDRSRIRVGFSRAFDLRLPVAETLSPPKNTFQLFAGFRFTPTVYGSLEYYYTSRNKWNDARVDDVSRLDRLDVRLEKSFRIGRYHGIASIQSELELSQNVSYNRRGEVDDMYFAKIELELP